MKIAAAWWSLSGDGFWPNGSAVNYLPYWERWLDTVGAEGVDLALVPVSRAARRPLVLLPYPRLYCGSRRDSTDAAASAPLSACSR